MLNPIEVLQGEGISVLLSRYSALARYFNIKRTGDIYLLTEAELPGLARIFESMEYPGLPLADALLEYGGRRYFFKCCESFKDTAIEPFPVLELLYNPGTGTFLDPKNIYYLLRLKVIESANGRFSGWLVVFEAAKLISQFHYNMEDVMMYKIDWHTKPPAECQKELLIELMAGRYPDKGLKFLMESGFIESCWPEIFSMAETEHSRDYHPEGNVWEHTLETLKYRKQFSPELSIALFLHDVGKAFSPEFGQKRFYGHSEVGAKIASKFLYRLGFKNDFIEKVKFLIKYHMLPGALKKLPLYRTKKLMDSDLFPVLLEVYRADISASYKNPEDYYEACRIYRGFLRNKKSMNNVYYL